METKVRKVVLCLLLIALILVGLSMARAGYIDLKGADVLQQSRCVHNGNPYVCVIVQLEDKVYVVLLDRKGEYAIYIVGETESTLLWVRDGV